MELRSLTGLRWLAALAVFVHHARQVAVLPVLDALGVVGATGVVLFYLLSGFVLSWSDRGVSSRVFYRNRVARIMPLHLVALLLAIPVMYADPPFAGAPLSLATLVLVALLLQAWVPWDPAVFFGGNPVSWSLSFEAFFYGLFPWLRRVAASTRVLLLVAVGGLVVPWLLLVVALALGTGSASGAFVARSPLSCVTLFLSGVCLGRAVRRGWRLRLWPGAAAGLVGLSWCAYLVAVVVAEPVTAVWLAFPVTAPAYALLVVSLASYELDGRASWLGSRPMVTLGVWSYAFYLVHLTVIHGVGLVLAPPPGSVWLAVVVVLGVLGASVGLSALLHRWVEAPAQARLRAPVVRRAAQAEPDLV
jgi:peptidoglycan/LPS O-acetylase OafA/YrhL